MILLAHIGVFAMGALSQTLADGGPLFIHYINFSYVQVYASASLVSFLSILPPPRLSARSSTYTSQCSSSSTAYTWLVPVLQDAPLKVFFQQKVELDLGFGLASRTGNGSVVRAETALTGLPAYIDAHIISQPRLFPRGGTRGTAHRGRAEPGWSLVHGRAGVIFCLLPGMIIIHPHTQEYSPNLSPPPHGFT